MSAQNSEGMSRAQSAASALQRRTIMPLPVPRGSKNPNRPAWESERHNGDLKAFRSDPLNVGMMLGHITDGNGRVLTDKFADTDLDWPEARIAARYFLPPTGMKWGRKSASDSHWGYRLTSLEGAHTIQTLTDPLHKAKKTGKKHEAGVMEVRFTGLQTLAPGSVIAEDGVTEEVVWAPDGDGDPTTIDWTVYERQVRKTYGTALLARYWTEGIRHLASGPLAGMLCRGGMDLPDAENVVRVVCEAAHETATETDDRLRYLRDTYAKDALGQPYTGATRLEEYIDPKIVARVRQNLGLQKSSGGGDIGPDGFPLSDIGNAERFAAKWDGKILYCDDQNEWWLYKPPVWYSDRKNEVYRMAVEVVNDFRARIATARQAGQPNLGNSTPDQWDRHLKEWGKTGKVRAMLELVKSLVPVVPEEFDAQDNLLNALDGTIVLDRATGQHYVREHSADDLLTKVWMAHYHPNATHCDVDTYRAQFVPEADRWEFIEEAVGYSLLGGPKRYNFQLLGPSHAGKSMLLRILSEQGGEYVTSLKYNSLRADERGGDRPRSDLVSLRGARLVTITEVPKGASFDTDLFNSMLSGGDQTAVRGAYERRVQRFAFTCSLWTSGNNAYGVKGDSDAAYTRIHVVKFEHPMPVDEQDDNREDAVVESIRTGDAFLACWLRGFSRLFGEKKGRLTPPDSVRDATAEVRRELDPIERMVDDLVEVTGQSEDRVLKSSLNSYAREVARGRLLDWGYKAQERFDKVLIERGARIVHPNDSGKKPTWEGVQLR